MHKTTHDGLSRCDPSLYSNLYDTRQRADLKKEVSASESISKDTIEINREKIKEEALSHLRYNAKYTVSQSSFMRVGKYLFVAVAFPPYFILYRVPKQIFVVVIPTMFNVVMNAMKKMKDKVQTPLKTIIARLAQPMQVFARVLIQPVARLFFEGKQAFKRMWQQSLARLQGGSAYLQTFLSTPLSKGKELVKAGTEKMMQSKERAIEYIKRKSTAIQEAMSGLKQLPLLFLGWSTQLIQKFNALQIPLKEKLGGRYQTVHQKADAAAGWVFKQMGHLQQKAQEIARPIVAFYRRTILPHWGKIKGKLSEKSKRALDGFKEKHKRALAYFEEKQEKVRKLSYLQWIDQMVSIKWIKWLPGSIQQMIHWLFHNPSLTRLWKGVFHLHSFFKQAVLYFFNGFLLIGALVSRSVAEGWNITREMVSTGWRYVTTGFTSIVRLFLYYSSFLVYYSVYFTIVAVILLGWGINLIAQMATEMMAKFPLPKQKKSD